MFDRMFGQVNLIQKGMDTAWLRQEVISHNIANADTPRYKTKHVEFEGALKAAMEKQNTTAWATHEGHFEFAANDPSGVQPTVVTENFHTMRMDENNVDIDQEMSELATNTVTYNAMVGQMNSEFNRLRTAISGN